MVANSPVPNTLRVALGQINTTVGDLDGNAKKITDYIFAAKKHNADVVIFPELAITGYPPEDLLFRDRFVDDNITALVSIAQGTDDITVIVGFADSDDHGIYNAAAVIRDGLILGIHRKSCLADHDYFNENRYFEKGETTSVYKLEDALFRVTIQGDAASSSYGENIIFDICSSPFHPGQCKAREQTLASLAAQAKCTIVQVNAIGGQDELVFAGQSLVVGSTGETLFRAKSFEEQLAIADIDIGDAKPINPCNYANAIEVSIEPAPKAAGDLTQASVSEPPAQEVEEVYSALVLGTRDYAHKNGFSQVALGMSGGLDSALVACIAADAVGAENVRLLVMPSIYSSAESQADAERMAGDLGARCDRVAINDLVESYREPIEKAFGEPALGIVEENLQARIRGNLLMALSNQYGLLVLNTSNKSEIACGYSTLYGDMAGGLAVLKSCYKSMVYKLSEYRNTISPVIPDSIILRPPSAELRPDQKDTDTLPCYDILDAILEAFIDRGSQIDEIVAMGYDEALVRRVMRMIDRSEYKRRQSAPGLRWGWDVKLPMTNARDK